MEKLETTIFRTHIVSALMVSLLTTVESILLSLLQELDEGLSSRTVELNDNFSALSLPLFLGKNDVMIRFGALIKMSHFPFAYDLTALSLIPLISNSFWQSLQKASILLPLLDSLS